jgi:aspartyl-tRNA(Asn)/glutamyl-tRNA(Gln) amidotransferase subunit A
VPAEYFGEGLDPEIEGAVRTAVAKLEELGAKVVNVSLPHTKYAVATYYLICTAEASSNLARYDGVRYGLRVKQPEDLLQMYTRSRHDGFGPEVKRRIILGTFALSAGYYDAYYAKGQRVRTLIRNDFRRAFEQCDVIVTPTSPVPAFRLGDRLEDPLQMYLADIYTISCNLAGLPGLSLPCGFSNEGLPIGLQLLGPTLGEEQVFTVAANYERATAWRDRRCEVVA